MKKTDIDKIMKKHKKDFEDLEIYDRTRQLPFQRKRIDITLSVETINKLRQINKKTGIPISRIIEEKF
ncbi:hypothetical protein COU57_00340 [Candidatus Pacearchaeota archaeon CG10_big_fil_rev_8_21_14_0_10_32_14]|nr:MAG: hypothetical protein COU57_00340 [Candidatus Pacearchaeota archaeon CG10_big_fil_rev_8_21_14_0_10_32_14]